MHVRNGVTSHARTLSSAATHLLTAILIYGYCQDTHFTFNTKRTKTSMSIKKLIVCTYNTKFWQRFNTYSEPLRLRLIKQIKK